MFRESQGKIDGTREAREEFGLVIGLRLSWIRPLYWKPEKEDPKFNLFCS